MPIGSFFSGLGDRLVSAGAAGSNPGAYYQSLQEQRKQQQLAEIMSSPVTPGEKISALAQVDPTFALQYMKQAQGPEMPADVREFQYMQSLPPEQRQAYQQFKQPGMTPYQQEQLAIERAKLENSEDYQRTQAQQRAQQLAMQAQALEQAGRRQEASILRQEAQALVSFEEPDKMYDYGTVPDPLARIQSPKRRDVEVGMLGREAEKSIQKQTELANKGREAIANLNQFERAMNRQGGSDTWIDRYAPEFIASFDPESAEMMSATAALTPTMREPGSGAASDADMRLFERATVRRGIPTETNKRIIAARKTAAQNMIDKVDFMEAYRADNGHVRGAETAWNRYLSANPIFAQDDPDALELNPNRKSWKEFFGGAQESNQTDLNLPSADAIEAELKRRGVM